MIAHLPSVYDLVSLDTADSVVEEARRWAVDGADEGLVVWAGEQTAATGRRGQPWVSPRGNLYCAILLRPEYPAKAGAQLCFVSAVSLGTAIADLAPPMTDLKYRWPNDILVNGAKVGSTLIRWGAGEPPEWLIVSLCVNVAEHPRVAGIAATSLQAEAMEEVTAVVLLEAYARHFLAWINRWGNDGFEDVRKTWTQRAEGLSGPMRAELPAAVMEGRFLDLDSEGSLVLEEDSGQRQSVPIVRAFDASN